MGHDFALNPLIRSVSAPPIAESQAWAPSGLDRHGRAIVDVAQAVPADPPDEALVRHLATRLGDPAVHRYTDIFGMPSLREALAAHMSSVYGGTVSPASVAITAGCNQAFCVAMMGLAQAGDDVLLPVPWYFNHRMWLDMLGIRSIPLAFRPDRAGVPDIAEAAASIGPRTRAIVLVTPNNPTGAIYSPDEIRAFYELARKARIALVIDETYKDFLPGQGAAHDLFRDEAWPGTLVQLYSFSKVFAITGHRVGSLIAGPRLMSSVEKIMDCVAICAPRLGQEAALFGLENLASMVARNRQAMADRAERFRAAVGSLPGWRLISVGAYFAYAAHPFGGTPAIDVARRLAYEHGILALPGSMFGPDQDAYLRLAFANLSDDGIATLVDRLAESLRAAA